MNAGLLKAHKNSVFKDKVLFRIKETAVVSSELNKLVKCEIFSHGSSARSVSVNTSWVHGVKDFPFTRI